MAKRYFHTSKAVDRLTEMLMRTELSGFVQIHIFLYEWTSLENIAEDLFLLSPSLFSSVRSLRNALKELRVVDSKSLGSSEDQFAYLHRLNDFVAIRFVRNEPPGEYRWSPWEALIKENLTESGSVCLGKATLLQCETTAADVNEQLLHSSLIEAVKNSPAYCSSLLDQSVLLPFGRLFELDPEQTLWLLVSGSGDERSSTWMIGDWLRLITFLKKHDYYAQLFEREIKELNAELTRITLARRNNLKTATVLLDQALDGCQMLLKHLRKAKLGYRNSVEETFADRFLLSKRKDFISRKLVQLKFSNTVFKKELESLQSRWQHTQAAMGIVPYAVGDEPQTTEQIHNGEPYFRYDVFLSYSSKDRAVVCDVAEKLKADGVRVWMDLWQVRPGDNIQATIEDGLEQSRVLVLFMSANAFATDWTQLEAGTFRFRDPLNKQRRFIPVRLDNSPIKGSLQQFRYNNWLAKEPDDPYAELLQVCRRIPASRQEDSLLSLQQEFHTPAENYVALKHIKLDWSEGSSDPTHMKFRKLAPESSDDSSPLFAGVNINPEFYLSFWFDTKDHRIDPGRVCKHWITIDDGTVERAISTWNHFKPIAQRAGQLTRRFGLRESINDPLERWLIIIHDVINPTRLVSGMVSDCNENTPDAIRIGNFQIATDWAGCSVIDDLHESSAATCRILTEKFTQRG